MNALLALALMADVSLPNDFAPRPYQRRVMSYLDNGGKRAFVVWPRRHGKDLVAGHQEAKAAYRQAGVYWHFFPTLEHGRRSLWEAFTADGKRTLECIFPGFLDPKRAGSIVARKNEQQMFIELRNGALWRVMGTDKIESVGAGPIGVVWSEFALSKPKAWNLVRPMLRENGGWSLFITTPRGNNHAKKLYDDAKRAGWFTDYRTVHDTGQTFASETRPGVRLNADEMMAEERASGMPEALIRQEYLCDWSAANVGAVFGDLVPDAHDFEHPRDGVYTSWDLGTADATAIWFWRLAEGGVDFIDHLEATGKPSSYFLDALRDRGYEYTRHYLPHDGKNRNWVNMATPQDALMAEYPGKVAVVPQDSLANGIQAGRWLLQRETRFHSRVAEGIEALRAYHFEWDDDQKVLAKTPLHDWSSHTADAFRYAASVVKQTRLIDWKPRKPFGPEEPVAVPVSESFTLDQLWAAAPKIRRRG